MHYLFAAGEEDQDLVPQMRLDEREQHIKLFVGFDHHVMLLEGEWCLEHVVHATLLLLVHRVQEDHLGSPQTQLRQLVDVLRQSGREQHRLAFLGNVLQDGLQGLPEAHL